MDLAHLVLAIRGGRPQWRERGITIADLQKKGAMALDDAQLKALVVGKTFKVRNRVTGDRFEILYGKDGRRLDHQCERKATPTRRDLGCRGAMARWALPLITRSAAVGIVTTLEMTPFEVTVYKLGDKYRGRAQQ